MKYYFTKTPGIVLPFARDLLWRIETNRPELYLTFDDGPTPGVTEMVLDILENYGARATFFCLGKNANDHPHLVRMIREKGHATAHHSWDHPNGWKTSQYGYLKNVLRAAEIIPSGFFRPPYGRITRNQVKSLKKRYRIVMWDVLAGDFDEKNTPEKCVKNVCNSAKPGSIIVFHDSKKAENNVIKSLPLVLDYFTCQGFTFKKLDND